MRAAKRAAVGGGRQPGRSSTRDGDTSAMTHAVMSHLMALQAHIDDVVVGRMTVMQQQLNLISSQCEHGSVTIAKTATSIKDVRRVTDEMRIEMQQELVDVRDCIDHRLRISENNGVHGDLTAGRRGNNEPRYECANGRELDVENGGENSLFSNRGRIGPDQNVCREDAQWRGDSAAAVEAAGSGQPRTDAWNPRLWKPEARGRWRGSAQALTDWSVQSRWRSKLTHWCQNDWDRWRSTTDPKDSAWRAHGAHRDAQSVSPVIAPPSP